MTEEKETNKERVKSEPAAVCGEFVWSVIVLLVAWPFWLARWLYEKAAKK